MIPPVVAVDPRRPAELGAQDDQCLVQQSIGMEVCEQGAFCVVQDRCLPWRPLEVVSVGVFIRLPIFHPSPGRRVAAVQSVAAQDDRVWLPVLVDLLEDPDPLVRMAANQALEDMVGFQTKYRAHAPASERRPYVETWRRRILGADAAATEPDLTPGDEATTFPPAEASLQPPGLLPPRGNEEGSR